MRIESVAVKNLRCIKDATVQVDPYTCFVGPNGAGKSTILCALNIFFRNLESAPTDLSSLVPEDFHLQDTNKPIEIAVTFTELSDEAKADFKEYVRQDRLTISAVAVFDPATGYADVKQYGLRLGMESLKPFFKALGDGVLVKDLQAIFSDLQLADPDLAALKLKTTKDAMVSGLHAYEESKPGACVLIPSEDQFYGFSRGANRLAKYVQWVFIPAVKDASDEQSGTKTSALGKLLTRTVSAKSSFGADLESLVSDTRSKYQAILDANQSALDGISVSLEKHLTEWAHPEASLKVVWENDPVKAVNVAPPLAGVVAGESGFEGKLARLGHGFQRSFLLALLQELAQTDDQNAPTLLLGCEEPELYQHPPQARHLSSVFESLSGQNAQIIVTSHSPYFVSGQHFESIRLVNRTGNATSSKISAYPISELAKRYAEVTGEPLRTGLGATVKLHQALQPSLAEMFFTQKLVLVEGLEDIAYIHAWFVVADKWNEFRKSGVHVVASNGKSELIRPAIIATELGISTMAVFDADGDKITKKDVTGTVVDNTSVRLCNEKENRALARIFGGDETNLFPSGVLWFDRLVVWPSDFGSILKNEFQISLGPQGDAQFEHIQNQARVDAGNAGGLEKNTMYIGFLLERLVAAKASSPSLEKLAQKILSMA
jgi:energy-coupling factor transporter ATP-binding protein EcfA2